MDVGQGLFFIILDTAAVLVAYSFRRRSVFWLCEKLLRAFDGFLQMFTYLHQTTGEKIQPAHQINMLLSNLPLISPPWIIIKPTSHKISLTTLILAMPSKKSICNIHSVFIFEALVGLSVLEVAVPHLKFTIVVCEETIQSLFEDGIGFGFVDESDYGEHECWWIHFEPILKNKPRIRHHATNLSAPDLLPSNPPKNINFIHPIGQDIEHNLRIIVDNNTLMESVIPEKRSRKNETTWGERVGVVLLMDGEGVLGVQTTVVEGQAGVEIGEGVGDEGDMVGGLGVDVRGVELGQGGGSFLEEFVVEAGGGGRGGGVCQVNAGFLAWFELAI